MIIYAQRQIRIMMKSKVYLMQADDIKDFSDEECGISEDVFPVEGKCCHKNGPGFIVTLECDCPYCRISKSLPYGTDMRTVTIFECIRLGYGRRITE